MSELLESNEFGDWLLGEIPKTRRKAKSVNPELAQAASVRLESLKLAKQVLLEFLTLQEAMLDAASAARRSKSASARDTSPSPMHAANSLQQAPSGTVFDHLAKRPGLQ